MIKKDPISSSKTYEPFMYLTVPVPNPVTRVVKVNFAAPHGSVAFIKIAVKIEREANVATLLQALRDELKQEQIQHGHDLHLYEVLKLLMLNYFETFSFRWFFRLNFLMRFVSSVFANEIRKMSLNCKFGNILFAVMINHFSSKTDV